MGVGVTVITRYRCDQCKSEYRRWLDAQNCADSHDIGSTFCHAIRLSERPRREDGQERIS